MITPVSTSAAPTNIPGLGGVPGCAAVLYPDGQACTYANCKIPLMLDVFGGTKSSGILSQIFQI